MTSRTARRPRVGRRGERSRRRRPKLVSVTLEQSSDFPRLLWLARPVIGRGASLVGTAGGGARAGRGFAGGGPGRKKKGVFSLSRPSPPPPAPAHHPPSLRPD